MPIEVVPATVDQQPMLANLLELYAYDFSEFLDLEMGPDGRFGYPHLHLYWLEPGRYPFVIKSDARVAGLVLVNKTSATTGNPAAWDIAEFFILRGYRRQGMGTVSAHRVWESFPGPWQLRVMESNQAGFHFWQHAISRFTGKPAEPLRVEKNGKVWWLFCFESQRRVGPGQAAADASALREAVSPDGPAILPSQSASARPGRRREPGRS